MSVAACAALVERGDPERFRAVMAAPVWARERLFPLYAFNLEVARAPWVTGEAIIAEMRLQWWRDALEEIASGGTVRRHEVVTPLAEVLDAETAALLDRLIEARRLDIGHGPEDAGAHGDYLSDTGGVLMTAAGRVLGADEADSDSLHRLGWAQGAANWLRAYPQLLAAGKQVFCGRGAEGLPALAREGLDRLRARPGSRLGRIAALAAFAAPPVLKRAAGSANDIVAGRLEPSPARLHMSLLWRTLRL